MTAAVFRFTAGGEPTLEPIAPAATNPTIEQRLRTLQELHDKKLITDEEYEKKKAEILKEI